jgi:hypothetical protein
MKHFLIEGTSLLVKARVVSRNNNNRDQLDVRINSITLLSEAMEKHTNEIILKTRVSALNEKTVDKLINIIQNEKGKCKLKFSVDDDSNGVSVEMPSPKFNVAASSFLKQIDDIEGISYKLIN